MPNLSNLDVNRAFGIYNQDQFQNEYYGDGIWNTQIIIIYLSKGINGK